MSSLISKSFLGKRFLQKFAKKEQKKCRKHKKRLTYTENKSRIPHPDLGGSNGESPNRIHNIAIMKTFSAKAQEIERKWYVIDAANQVLGQVAVQAANLLRGKNKTIFTPHVDCGDYVIVVNADKVVLTGNKERAKIYTRYTGYVGNQVVTTPAKLRRNHPEQILEHAILGMVPHTRQGRAQSVRLKVYAGAEHKHAAQNPEAVTIA